MIIHGDCLAVLRGLESESVNCCKKCGIEFTVNPSNVRKGMGIYCSKKCYFLDVRFGKKLSESTRQKMSVARMGANNPNWHGGEKAHNKRRYLRVKNKIEYRLNSRMRCSINNVLKGGSKNNQRWETIVGYTCTQLKTHLNKTMPKGYTWQDFLDGELHIDHIIPVIEFRFGNVHDLQFKACWSLENLRLLPKIENLSKNKKLIKPFQLILPI